MTTISPNHIAQAATRCIASYLTRLDENERTRYCGYEEAQRMVGATRLDELLQRGEIEYIAPRQGCARNAKWRIRRLHLLPYTRPVADANEYIANNINQPI